MYNLISDTGQTLPGNYPFNPSHETTKFISRDEKIRSTRQIYLPHEAILFASRDDFVIEQHAFLHALQDLHQLPQVCNMEGWSKWKRRAVCNMIVYLMHAYPFSSGNVIIPTIPNHQRFTQFGTGSRHGKIKNLRPRLQYTISSERTTLLK